MCVFKTNFELKILNEHNRNVWLFEIEAEYLNVETLKEKVWKIYCSILSIPIIQIAYFNILMKWYSSIFSKNINVRSVYYLLRPWSYQIYSINIMMSTFYWWLWYVSELYRNKKKIKKYAMLYLNAKTMMNNDFDKTKRNGFSVSL